MVNAFMNSVFLTVRWACVLSVLTLCTDGRISADEVPHDMPAATEVDPTALDPLWLEPAKHPRTGLLSRNIRPEEAAGYFAILNHARQLPQSQLQTTARRFEKQRREIVKNDPKYRFAFRDPHAAFPTFFDLHQVPELYHGKLVTFRGHLRRLMSFPAGQNAYGFQQLHEAWLYAGDAQQNPVVVICSELPPEIPTGGDLLVDFVSATGYFFKRYGYEDRSGQPRFAPLILAQRLEWTPPTPRHPLLSTRTFFWLVVGIAVIIGVICWRRRSRFIRGARGSRATN